MTLGSLLLSVALVHSSGHAGQDKVWKDVYDKAKRAVVTIKTDVGVGSGFVVSMTKKSNYTQKWTEDLKKMNDTLLKNTKLEDCTFILTAFHVISDATEVEIVPNIGKKAKNPILYGYDASRDIAVLLVKSDLLTGSLPLGDYAKADVGDPVAVVGNPLGFLPGTLSTGIVSAKRNSEGVPLLQFTASVSEGSSGSPVMNKAGEVIGMVRGSLTEGQSLNIAVGSGPLKTSMVNVDRVFTDWSSNRSSTGSMTKEEIKKNEAVGEVTAIVCESVLQWFAISMALEDNEKEYERIRDLALTAIDPEEHAKYFAKQGGSATEASSLRKEIETVSLCLKALSDAQQAATKISKEKPGSKDADDAIDRAGKAYHALSDAMYALGDSFASTWYDFDIVSEKVSGAVLFEVFLLFKLPVFPDLDAKECEVHIALDDEFEDGDIIVGIKLGNGQNKPVKNWKDLWRILDPIEDETTAEVTVKRDGQTIKIKTKVE